MTELQMTKVPAVDVGLLIRREPEVVFEALVDPAVTTNFWYTKSSGRMSAGARLVWEWEMYGARTDVSVDETEDNRLVRFHWSGYDPTAPTEVTFRLEPMSGGTYVRVTETGFGGDADTLVDHVLASTAGFTFVLASLKAFLEHDLALGIIEDAHPEQRVA